MCCAQVSICATSRCNRNSQPALYVRATCKQVPAIAFITVLPLPLAPLGADPDRPFCQVYTFQLGDTLKSVAEKFDTTEAELIKLNSGGCRIDETAVALWSAWTQKKVCLLGLCSKGAACLQLQGFRHSPLCGHHS